MYANFLISNEIYENVGIQIMDYCGQSIQTIQYALFDIRQRKIDEPLLLQFLRQHKITITLQK